LHTPVAEELIYYAPLMEGCAMGWLRKRTERQPHLAPEQREDDTRARRKTNGCGGQEVQWRGRKAGRHAWARWRCRPASAQTLETIGGSRGAAAPLEGDFSTKIL
jgi:hypothetical protein